MILPSDELAGGIDTALQIVKADGAIVVVMKVVFASPEKFDGRASFLGDGRGFDHVIVGETAAKSATGAAEVNRDIRFGNFENVGDEAATIFRSLARRPDFMVEA